MARRPRSLPGLFIHLVKIYAGKHRGLAWGLGTLAGLGVLGGLIAAGTMMSPCGADKAQAAAPLAEVTSCDDPVEGVWEGHQYVRGDKYHFTVRVERTSPGSSELEGRILSHYWTGSQTSMSPSACGDQGDDFVIGMPAEGSYEGGVFEFGGVSWELEEERCGDHWSGYAPDHFTGQVEGNAFHATNDDGYNRPTFVSFQRKACLK